MTAQQQAFDAKVEQKINEMMPYLIKTARGDEDLIQEGAIGIWESMMKDPEAPAKYYATKAKWEIQSVARGVGKSVDIPKWYKRKTPIHIVNYDAELSQAVLADRRRISLDEYVISKIDFERFIATLYSTEAEYVRCKLVDEVPDSEASDRLNISLVKLREMKKALRLKVEAFFTW
jgi:DNA-directed RNA polymerase specialized sigma24 family protein